MFTTMYGLYHEHLADNRQNRRLEDAAGRHLLLQGAASRRSQMRPATWAGALCAGLRARLGAATHGLPQRG
jgi:hypothetical protein